MDKIDVNVSKEESSAGDTITLICNIAIKDIFDAKIAECMILDILMRIEKYRPLYDDAY